MSIDREIWGQWLDQDLAGCLGASEKAQLEELRRTNPEVRREQRLLESLDSVIQAEAVDSRIAVQPGFSARVMGSLPKTWWEQRSAPARSGWLLPLAMLLALAFGAVWMLAGSQDFGPVAGIGLAVLDFVQTTALAGAGMLFATWRGFSLGLEEMIGGSGLNLFALASSVLCLNLLFLSLLRRRSPVMESADAAGADARRSEN